MAISDDLNSIRTHLEDDYKALETLGVSVEDRNIENIKDMGKQIYAKFPKTPYAEGSNITLENCLKGKLDYEDDKVGYGDTKQEGEPTPTTPIPIQVVTGEQEVVVRGKNLFDNSNIKASTYICPCKIGDIFVMSFKGYASTNNSRISLRTYDGEWAEGLTSSVDNTTLYLSTSEDTYTAIVTSTINGFVYVRFGSSLSTYTLSNMQVEKNNEATTYEPYITPITKQLSLGDKELFEDSFISYENGDFYFNDNFIRYIGKVTFSSFDTTYNRCSGSYSISAPGLTNTVTSAYCTTLQFVTGSIYKTNPNGTFQVRGQATTNSFHLWLDNITTEEQARTYLSNTDFNIVSATKEPIKTKITDTTLINQLEDIYNIQSVNGTTIIEINGNLPMIMKVRALWNGNN